MDGERVKKGSFAVVVWRVSAVGVVGMVMGSLGLELRRVVGSGIVGMGGWCFVIGSEECEEDNDKTRKVWKGDLVVWMHRVTNLDDEIDIERTRLSDSTGRPWFERERDLSVTGVDAYMKTFGVSENIAIDEVKKMVENAWKEINEGCLKPRDVPMYVLAPIVNLAHMIDVACKYIVVVS
ncbi:terpenoid cyclases/protein prenyltransferase alpha-alpha toroid [Artemisia annua]|uniref:Terpenoid cyclases/protein prenyltransferase alpha-alpha toroid n=1 Tax=Artemisia annua TaxID=35608 RepID=A0A2U1NNF1_ARTAN|nr:terpenoid cyclases/protein prenyltransferase alpha-alpha toroid [Artemisia annua]